MSWKGRKFFVIRVQVPADIALSLLSLSWQLAHSVLPTDDQLCVGGSFRLPPSRLEAALVVAIMASLPLLQMATTIERRPMK